MSTMYTYTRQEVADMLWISTRSVDRYIKSGKLRSKKEGKIVYVNDDDVKNLSWDTENKQEIIIENDEEIQENIKENYNVLEEKETGFQKIEVKWIEVKSKINNSAIEKIYEDLRDQIKQKDEVIQDLSIKLWRAEEIVKNSVSMIDFKRSQMLLEDSKTHLWSAISELKSKNESLEEKAKSDKKTIWALLIAVTVLLFIAAITWALSI